MYVDTYIEMYEAIDASFRLRLHGADNARLEREGAALSSYL